MILGRRLLRYRIFIVYRSLGSVGFCVGYFKMLIDDLDTNRNLTFWKRRKCMNMWIFREDHE